MVGTMRRLLLPLCAALLLAPASGASASGGTGRLLVTVTPGAQRAPAARAAAAQAVAASADARPSGFSVPQIGLVTVRPRPGESMRALARRLRADPRVASVQAENRGRVRFQPNDPALVAPEPSPASVPGTTVEWWAARSNFLAAWDLSDGSGARVAVIDTGAEIAHPEFIGRVAGLTSFDATRSPAGLDTIGHGTHVASLACAAGNNGVGLVGAGLGCRLLVVKSDFSDSSVAASIVWAVDHGADAITMSFGTAAGAQPSLPVVNAIDYAVKRGVVLVSAAADDPIADQGYPSSVLQPTNTGPDLSKGRGLSVTAADFYDRRASFAGYGTQISLAAYGSYTGGTGSGPPGIFGAFTSAQNALDTGALGNMRPCGCRTTFGADARYAYLQGTSMAAPMVAAASALVRRLNPDLTARQIVRLMKESARRPAGTGWSPDLGWGILDAGAAVTAARNLDGRPPASKVRRLAAPTGSKLTVRWRGRDVPRRNVALSGIARYELWRSTDGRRARRLLTTTRTSRRVTVRRGARYGFFTVAIDKAGNREPKPKRPDARLTVR